MKKLIIFFLAVTFCTHLSYSQSSWQVINPPATGDFISVCFTDELHGWIISETGTIIWTTDAGITWSDVSFPEYHFQSVHFSDNGHGCIVGWQEMPSDSSLILMTTNGGDDWLIIDHFKVNRFNDVFFINNDIGWAVGSQDQWEMNCCFYTNDGGLTWDYQSSILQVGAKLFGVSFRDENLRSTCGADGAFFSTMDGGYTWAMNISMPLLNLNRIFNFGMLTGCCVGDQGKVLYTKKNWYQYIEQNSNTSENLNGVSGHPATNKLWAVGDNGTIIYSPNYLLGWTSQFSGITENLNDVCMLSSTNGWAVGNNGTILHFANEVGITENSASLDITVYPNPTRNETVISFPESIYVFLIQVVTLNGESVFYLDLNRESFSQKLDLSGLSSGVYVLKVYTNKGLISDQLMIK